MPREHFEKFCSSKNFLIIKILSSTYTLFACTLQRGAPARDRISISIFRLLNVVAAKNDKDIYLVFEYMDTDLHAVIRKGGILQDAHQRYIMAQLLRATAYLHSGNVIHRDHKPSNILLDSDCLGTCSRIGYYIL